MEIVAFLRVLWRHRIVVAAGVVLALGLGFLFTRGTTTRYGVASTRVVLDTPASQLVDVEPTGADTLGWRAALLADLMQSDAGRPRIAAAMREPANQIAIVAPYMGAPFKVTPLATRALEAAAVTPEPYVVSVQAPGPLPIIAIDTSAPTAAGAARLATATADALKAAADVYHGNPELLQEFVVDSVGPVRAKEILDGPRRMMVAGVTVMFFVFWCGCVVAVSGVMRARRETRPHMRAAALGR